jgi:hypothetical protein
VTSLSPCDPLFLKGCQLWELSSSQASCGLRLRKLPEKHKGKEDGGPEPYAVARGQEPVFSKGWAEGLATPLTINGLAKAPLEPPLALPPQLSQLGVPTNGRHQPITPARKELAKGCAWRRFLGGCQKW